MLQSYFVDPSATPLAATALGASVTCRERTANDTDVLFDASGGRARTSVVWALAGLLAAAAVAGLAYFVRAKRTGPGTGTE